MIARRRAGSVRYHCWPRFWALGLILACASKAPAGPRRIPTTPGCPRLNSRCWARGLLGTDLPLALKDCDAAMRRADKGTAFFADVADSRGLVYLRLGAYDKSISDYDASLKIAPKNAWAWYGRGVDKLRKQALSAGQADIAQATTLSPKIAEQFSRRGLSP
jgi:tetratricopeptide (TPR) repeat protein